MRRAARPVAGGGVRASGAAAELRALAEKLNIPVATSLNAKDVLSGDHPLNVGVPGVYARASANQVLSVISALRRRHGGEPAAERRSGLHG